MGWVDGAGLVSRCVGKVRGAAVGSRGYSCVPLPAYLVELLLCSTAAAALQYAALQHCSSLAVCTAALQQCSNAAMQHCSNIKAAEGVGGGSRV